jgi:hypothetical protein
MSREEWMKKREVETVVIAECVACKARKEIHAGEVGKNDMPTCDKCYNPMVAVSVKAKLRREKKS